MFCRSPFGIPSTELGTAVNGVNALRSQLTENKLVKEVRLAAFSAMYLPCSHHGYLARHARDLTYEARADVVTVMCRVPAKQELDQLEEGAKVYKLVGPVLIPQDVDEARSTVETRIGYISKELGAAENRVQTLEKTQQEKRMKLVGEQQKYQALAQQASAALVAAQ